ncbi:MAG: hypothetical protein ACREUA_09480, partial [Burkholderiales bacterium]
MTQPLLQKRTLLMLMLSGLPQVSLADEPPWVNLLPQWHWYGSNTLRMENYQNYGDETASPYPEEGEQAFDEFFLNFNNRRNPYDTWRGQVYGVLNASDYRSDERGVVPERISLVRDLGTGDTPHRLEMGDYFGYFSYRTLQRSLKGVQIEFQPAVGPSGRRHSVQILAGENQSQWRDLDVGENFTVGGSWLVDDQQFGRWSFNWVHNLRDPDDKLGLLRRDQDVFSIAAEKEFSFSAQDMTFEGELANFSGDHNGVAGASGEDRDELGVFLQMSGKSKRWPLTYRLRFEDYGQDYQPAGAVVTPDRRSREAHAGWRFDSGLLLRARIQNFEDGVELANTLDTDTYGINLSGPFFAAHVKNLTGNLSAYVQNADDSDNTVDRETRNVALNLNKPLPMDWNGRLGLFYQSIDDDVAGAADSVIRQVALSGDHAIAIGPFTGTVTPGVLWRGLRGGITRGNEWSPTLAL